MVEIFKYQLCAGLADNDNPTPSQQTLPLVHHISPHCKLPLLQTGPSEGLQRNGHGQHEQVGFISQELQGFISYLDLNYLFSLGTVILQLQQNLLHLIIG